VRYLTCRRCGLKVKTEERLAVPWNERDLMALVAQAFPEGAVADVATLKMQGLSVVACHGSISTSSPTAGKWTW
jgi:hypothetical protein